MYAIVAKLFLIVTFFYRSSACVVNDQFYPYYHLAPPCGWMNDPNGFSYFNKKFHLFYQYNPLTSQEAGIAHWGHAYSTDLFHWTHLKIAMYPDQEYDKSGVFSGSAIVVDDKMYLLYTGNVNYPDQNPDHVQRQALAYSSDGVNVTKYPENPVILAEEHQPDIRDPHVWKHGDMFYMVLGNSFNNSTLGRVLLYGSEDLKTWKELSVLDESDGSLGYMWECPGFYQLGGKFVLEFSPQGVQPQGDKYRNLYQNGYIIGDFDYETYMFTPITEFREYDHGHDFYALQSMFDESGRRVAVAWFDMWEQVYPERNDGFTGQMTIPRVLHLTSDLRIIQKPVKEILGVRGGLLYTGKGGPGTCIKLTNNTGEIKVEAPKNKDFEIIIEAGNTTVTILYEYLKGRVTLDRGGNDGIRRTKWRPGYKLQMQLFVDRSSLELFCGEGEVTFSSRYFPYGEASVRLGKSTQADKLTVYSMRRTVPAP